MRSKLRLALVMAFGGAVVLALALWPRSAQNPRSRHSDVRTYTIADSTGDWGYPTPYGMYPRGPGYIRMSFLFDTLVWKNAEGFVGALAERWTYDPQNKTYTFHLRNGLRWHDGQPLSSADVAFTFDYMSQHPWPWMKSGVVAEVRTPGQGLVEVVLNRPYAPFLANVAGTMPILPRHIWSEVEDPETFRGPQALVGSGPYRLVDYSPAHGSYLYRAWDSYYGGQPRVDRLRFVKYSEETTPVALRTGEINAGSVPPESVRKLDDAGLRVAGQPPVWAAKLMINHRKKPLSDKTFRRALAYAIDRERLVTIVRRGHGIVGSTGLIPPTNKFWHNPDVRPYPHKPETARRLLRALGYERDESGFFMRDGDGLSLTMLVSPERQEFGRLAEMLKKQFGRAGIRVHTRSVEARTLDAMVGEWRFDLAISGHGGLGGDPEILNKMILGKSFNSARYRANDRLTELLHKQVQQTNRDARRELVREIQGLYAADLPAITLYHPRWYWAHDGSIDLYYTPGGLALGIPLPINKHAFVAAGRGE